MDQDDPADWSIDQVIQQLCNTQSPVWAVGLNLKPISKPEVVAKAFEDNDIDGDTLLTLNDENLKKDLEIQSFGLRRALHSIITHLRRISPKYQELHPVNANTFATPNMSHASVASRGQSAVTNWLEIQPSIEGNRMDAQTPTRGSNDEEPAVEHRINPLKRLREESERSTPKVDNTLLEADVDAQQVHSHIAAESKSLPKLGQSALHNSTPPMQQGPSFLNTLDSVIDDALDTPSGNESTKAQDGSLNSSIPQERQKKPVKRAVLIPITDKSSLVNNPAFVDMDVSMTGVVDNFNRTGNTGGAGVPTAKRRKITDGHRTLVNKIPGKSLSKHKYRKDQLVRPKTGSSGMPALIAPDSTDNSAFQSTRSDITSAQAKDAFQSIKASFTFISQPFQQFTFLPDTFEKSAQLGVHSNLNLPADLQRLIERYPTTDEPPLPCYGDSDEEDRFTSASESTPVPDSQQVKHYLTTDEINSVIDDCFDQYRADWNSRHLTKAQARAHKKWMSAAKNYILHRNILASCKREQDALEARIRHQRKGIHLNQWQKAEDVKQQCLGSETSFHQLLEYKLYVDVLQCEEEPLLPPSSAPKQSRISRHHTTLPNGDEELDSDSADSFVVDDDDEEAEQRNGDNNSVENGMNWNPQYADKRRAPHQEQAHADTAPLDENQDIIIDSIEEPNVLSDVTFRHIDQIQGEQNASDGLISGDQRISVSNNDNKPAIKDKVAVKHGKRKDLQTPFGSDFSDNDSALDSDFERVPQIPKTQYRRLGKSKEKAIDLTSSSPPSRVTRAGSMLSDLSIYTPRLSPVGSALGLNTKSSGRKRRSGTSTQVRSEGNENPNLQLIMQPKLVARMDWSDIRPEDETEPPDSRLALAKSIYEMSVQQTLNILDYVKSFRNDPDLEDVVNNGIYTLQEFLSDVEDVERKNQDNAHKLTELFISYALGCEVDSEFDISESQINDAYEVLKSGFETFRSLIIALMERHIDASRSRSTSNDAVVNDYSADSGTDTDADVITSNERQDEPSSASKIRRRKVAQDVSVLKQQRLDQHRVKNQEQQRARLLEQQSALGIGSEQLSVSININHPIVYLPSKIAARIKPHQTDGIRFMWREIIENPRREGCLLAHTMGLGKTLQVISLLASMSECASSSDPQMRSHIPEQLQSPRIMIICPSALVDNWNEELENWLPDPGMLGTRIKMDAHVRNPGITIKWWYDNGGVLIISYDRFRGYVLQRGNPERVDPERQRHLTEGPSIVIADEAHKLKNANSLINQAAHMIETKSRIAMTGSPLNNYLEEYHTMINWISPGYLGNMVQFKARYIEPISRGLYSESTSWERRASMKRLHMLKRIITPKINRADITAISKDLPPKTEFILTLTLTEKQKQAYQFYVEHLRSNGGDRLNKTANTRVWSWLNILSLLLSHPSCFIEKLQKQALGVSFTARTQPAESDDDVAADDGADGAIAALSAENIDVGKQPDLANAMEKVMNVFAEVPHRMSDPNLSHKTLLIKHIVEEAVRLDEKTLIFSKSIPALNYYERMVQDMGLDTIRIDGQKTTGRQQLTHAFNINKLLKVCLISTKAGGLGLNIQSANRVILTDFDFNPTWEEQAVGRAYRMGQKKPVFVYRFLMGGTFEELIHNKAVFKTQLFTRVVDEKNVIAQAGKKPGEFLFDPKEVEKKNFDNCLGRDPEVLDRVLQKVDCVRDIFLTETFYQEDDSELNEQELKEADDLLELERLEHENPEEYARRRKAMELEAVKANLEQQTAARARNLQTSTPRMPANKDAWFAHYYAPNIPVQTILDQHRSSSMPMSPLYGHLPRQAPHGMGHGDEFVNGLGQSTKGPQPFRDDQAINRASQATFQINPSMSFFNNAMQTMSPYFGRPSSQREKQRRSSEELMHETLMGQNVINSGTVRNELATQTPFLPGGLAPTMPTTNFGTASHVTAETYHDGDTTEDEAEVEKAKTAAGCRTQ